MRDSSDSVFVRVDKRVRATEKAIAFQLAEEPIIWIPRSQILADEAASKGRVWVPRWFAQARGLKHG